MMPKFESYLQGTPSYVELMTPDQAAAKEFYGGLFGWEFEDVDMGEAGVYVAVVGRGRLGRRDRRPDAAAAGAPGVLGRLPRRRRRRRDRAKVAEAGGKVEAGPFDVMELGRMASIQDPTGARVNLWQAGRASARCGSTSPAARSGTS